MQIIIPLSGVGQRFADAGYTEIKPLIKIQGKTMLSYVIRLFDRSDDFIFICNEDHLATTNLKEVILEEVPHAKIIAIAPHKKGPVFALQQAFSWIDDTLPYIVNYCDFFMLWNYPDFLSMVQNSGCDGAIPCYTGFHPHLIPEKNIYAGCVVDAGNKLLQIKEKCNFTENKFKGHHSTGTYYFKTGTLLKYYINHLIDADHHLNGEFYASMLYEQMLADGKDIRVFDNISHFCQWGTPEDLEDYLSWESFFLQTTKPETLHFPKETILLMPMAGDGKRFAEEGYILPKPFIPVDGVPMFYRSMLDFPRADKNIFITKQLPEAEYIPDHAEFIQVSKTTQGQAATCLLAQDKINNDFPLLIAPCDTGMQYDQAAFLTLCQSSDVILFTFRHSNAVIQHPEQYGWVRIDANNHALEISCKKKISDFPKNDPAIVGAFWFKKGSDFVQAASAMIAAQRTIGKEYYVDECIQDCIQKGLRVKVFFIDKYIGWGTPNDLKTYLYWQTFFKLV